MLFHLLKCSVRHIRKHKLNFSLNIVGLAIAITCCFDIYVFVQHELSYENCFSKADKIFRTTIASHYGDTHKHWAVGPLPLASELRNYFPEIEAAVRLRKTDPIVFSCTSVNGYLKQFEEKRGFYADPSFFPIFDLNFLYGAADDALNDVSSIVITEEVAHRYFGSENPLGKILIQEDGNQSFKVTGVVKNLPSNTHLGFDFLLPFQRFESSLPEDWRQSRTWKAVYNYVLLNRVESQSTVESRLSDFRFHFLQLEGSESEDSNKEAIHLQPIKDIHLKSRLEQEIGLNSDMRYIYIFSSAAILLLVLACVNYVNISTAQSLKRIKEVGLRKVVGARQSLLVKQFLLDTLLITIAAMLMVVVLVDLVYPVYVQLSGIAFQFGALFTVKNILLALAFFVILCIFAGIYPALYISSFHPIGALSNYHSPGSSVSVIRKSLFVLQFAISIFLILSTLTIFRQLDFFQKKDMGFDKEKIFAVKLYGELRSGIFKNSDVVKAELLRDSGITHVTLVSNLPGERFSVEHFWPVGTDGPGDLPTVRFMRTDENFLNTLNIHLLEGRQFMARESKEKQFIVSQDVLTTLGIENPIDKKMNSYFGSGEIVGVVPNFHFASLHQKIEPLVIEYQPNWTGYLLLKFTNMTDKEAVQLVREKVNAIAPNHLFTYTFVDDQLNRLYDQENRIGRVFRLFSTIGILISCLGLFGLSVYTSELKIKEFGIRKVLGASTLNIAAMFSKEFTKWVLIANLFAWPIAWYAMNRWLQNFAYHIEMSWWMFALAGGLALVIALLTVSWQAIRSATANPVESLRYE